MTGAAAHMAAEAKRAGSAWGRLRAGVKPLLRDASALAAQAARLPHNRSHAQIRAARQRITADREAIARHRVSAIARAAGVSEASVEAAVREMPDQPWVAALIAGQSEALDGGVGMQDGLSLYALVKALRPRVCVETGVASGYSSTILLSVLHANGEGLLHSIDVDGPHAPALGERIPAAFRDRWHMRLQRREPLLPGLLAELGEIDFFLHDSLHRVRHMAWEYALAWAHLKPGGCLASHDVVYTSAFEDFRRKHAPEIADGAVLGNFGFLVKR